MVKSDFRFWVSVDGPIVLPLVLFLVLGVVVPPSIFQDRNQNHRAAHHRWYAALYAMAHQT